MNKSSQPAYYCRVGNGGPLVPVQVVNGQAMVAAHIQQLQTNAGPVIIVLAPGIVGNSGAAVAGNNNAVAPATTTTRKAKDPATEMRLSCATAKAVTTSCEVLPKKKLKNAKPRPIRPAGEPPEIAPTPVFCLPATTSAGGPVIVQPEGRHSSQQTIPYQVSTQAPLPCASQQMPFPSQNRGRGNNVKSLPPPLNQPFVRVSGPRPTHFAQPAPAQPFQQLWLPRASPGHGVVPMAAQAPCTTVPMPRPAVRVDNFNGRRVVRHALPPSVPLRPQRRVVAHKPFRPHSPADCLRYDISRVAYGSDAISLPFVSRQDAASRLAAYHIAHDQDVSAERLRHDDAMLNVAFKHLAKKAAGLFGKFRLINFRRAAKLHPDEDSYVMSKIMLEAEKLGPSCEGGGLLGAQHRTEDSIPPVGSSLSVSIPTSRCSWRSSSLSTSHDSQQRGLSSGGSSRPLLSGSSDDSNSLSPPVLERMTPLPSRQVSPSSILVDLTSPPRTQASRVIRGEPECASNSLPCSLATPVLASAVGSTAEAKTTIERSGIAESPDGLMAFACSDVGDEWKHYGCSPLMDESFPPNFLSPTTTEAACPDSGSFIHGSNPPIDTWDFTGYCCSAPTTAATNSTVTSQPTTSTATAASLASPIFSPGEDLGSVVRDFQAKLSSLHSPPENGRRPGFLGFQKPATPIRAPLLQKSRPGFLLSPDGSSTLDNLMKLEAFALSSAGFGLDEEKPESSDESPVLEPGTPEETNGGGREEVSPPPRVEASVADPPPKPPDEMGCDEKVSVCELSTSVHDPVNSSPSGSKQTKEQSSIVPNRQSYNDQNTEEPPRSNEVTPAKSEAPDTPEPLNSADGRNSIEPCLTQRELSELETFLPASPIRSPSSHEFVTDILSPNPSLKRIERSNISNKNESSANATAMTCSSGLPAAISETMKNLNDLMTEHLRSSPSNRIPAVESRGQEQPIVCELKDSAVQWSESPLNSMEQVPSPCSSFSSCSSSGERFLPPPRSCNGDQRSPDTQPSGFATTSDPNRTDLQPDQQPTVRVSKPVLNDRSSPDGDQRSPDTQPSGSATISDWVSKPVLSDHSSPGGERSLDTRASGFATPSDRVSKPVLSDHSSPDGDQRSPDTRASGFATPSDRVSKPVLSDRSSPDKQQAQPGVQSRVVLPIKLKLKRVLTTDDVSGAGSAVVPSKAARNSFYVVSDAPSCSHETEAAERVLPIKLRIKPLPPPSNFEASSLDEASTRSMDEFSCAESSDSNVEKRRIIVAHKSGAGTASAKLKTGPDFTSNLPQLRSLKPLKSPSYANNNEPAPAQPSRHLTAALAPMTRKSRKLRKTSSNLSLKECPLPFLDTAHPSGGKLVLKLPKKGAQGTGSVKKAKKRL